jgi:hypothetical protein
MNKLSLAVPLGLALLLPGAPYLAEARPRAEAPKLLSPVHLTVNTADDEDEPHVADGGLTLYYACTRKGKVDILVSTRRNTALAWPKGKVLEDFVSTEGDDRSTYATEGRYPRFLYFATKKDKKGTNFDLYVAVKQAAGRSWSSPTPVHAVATEADELHPWVTADGKQLYFSRRTEDGWRVFVTKRAVAAGPQGWVEPQLVKELPAGFHHATLTPDGKTMYLQGPLGKGRWGLCVSTRTASAWSKPEPLEGLNHPDGKTGDRSPNLSRNGAMLYFASDRPGGKGGLDLYVIQTALLRKKK